MQFWHVLVAVWCICNYLITTVAMYVNGAVGENLNELGRLNVRKINARSTKIFKIHCSTRFETSSQSHDYNFAWKSKLNLF